MAQRDGVVNLTLLDVYKRPLQGKVDVFFRHHSLNDFVKYENLDASQLLQLTGLYSQPQGIYEMEIRPEGYLPVGQFVNVLPSAGTSIEKQLPVNPSCVGRVIFPEHGTLTSDLQGLLVRSSRVKFFEGMSGKSLYDALDWSIRAGLLNLFAKSSRTGLSSGQMVFPLIRELTEVRQDRFLALVPQQLREETRNSVDGKFFYSVSEALHDPPEGYIKMDSYKTHDDFGNLQLSFFRSSTNPADWALDMDIDDASGLGHVFQVLRNSITGRPTHPYDIHEILVTTQGIDPGYTFRV